MSFRGRYEHSLDAKARTTLPIQFREQLGDKFIVTRGLEKCLFVYTAESWAAYEAKADAIPVTDEDGQWLIRFFFGAARDAEFDGNGRFVIPRNLMAYAGIEKEVVSMGLPGRIEIWSRENLDAYDGMGNRMNENLARRMAEIGF